MESKKDIIMIEPIMMYVGEPMSFVYYSWTIE